MINNTKSRNVYIAKRIKDDAKEIIGVFSSEKKARRFCNKIYRANYEKFVLNNYGFLKISASEQIEEKDFRRKSEELEEKRKALDKKLKDSKDADFIFNLFKNVNQEI